MKPLLRPMLTLSAASFCCLLLIGWDISILMQEPSLGIQWQQNDSKNGLRVASVSEQAHEAGVKAGQVFVRIVSKGGASVAFTADSIIEDPDMHQSYAEYNAFFEHQSALHILLRHSPVTLMDEDGSKFSFETAKKKLVDIPWNFWFQVLCGTLAFLAGLAVLAFQPLSLSARYYALNGFSFLLITFSAAVYSSRELALDGVLVHTLSAINHLGAMLFSASFIALFWHIPKPLYSARIPVLITITFLLWWLADTWQLFSASELGVFVPIVFSLLGSCLLGAMQWMRSKKHPEQRAALRWILLSMIVGGSSFVALIIIGNLFGTTLLISQSYAFGFILLIYLGISLGIIRHGLFDLERWWANVWLWLLGGVLVISLDSFLVWAIGWQEDEALIIALLLAGWLYFPCRQYLIQVWLKRETVDMQKLLPELVQRILLTDNQEDTEAQWGELLGQVYHSMSFKKELGVCAEIEVKNQGLELYIPALTDGSSSWCIAYPEKGTRLFSHEDIKLATAVLTLATRMLDDKQRYQKSIEAERARISRDIHDDLGARLLSILHNSNDEKTLQSAEDGIADMRVILNDLHGKAIGISSALGELRLEVASRLADAGVNLSWSNPDLLPQLTLSARQFNNLKRVFREIITNAIRHAKVEELIFMVSFYEGYLQLSVEQVGDAPDIQRWGSGRGTQHMQTRMNDLNGSCVMNEKHGRLCITLEMPL